MIRAALEGSKSVAWTKDLIVFWHFPLLLFSRVFQPYFEHLKTKLVIFCKQVRTEWPACMAMMEMTSLPGVGRVSKVCAVTTGSALWTLLAALILSCCCCFELELFQLFIWKWIMFKRGNYATSLWCHRVHPRRVSSSSRDPFLILFAVHFVAGITVFSRL